MRCCEISTSISSLYVPIPSTSVWLKKLRASEMISIGILWRRPSGFTLKLSLSIVSRIFSVPFRLIYDRFHLDAVLSTCCHQAVARDEIPVVFFIRAWLARDDDVFAVVFNSFGDEAICRICSVRIVWVFSVQGGAGDC